MKKLIILVGFIIVTGCGHTHPIAEHQHPHEHDHHHNHQHDHTHELPTVALHKELVGKYELQEYTDDNNLTFEDQASGTLTIGADYTFTIDGQIPFKEVGAREIVFGWRPDGGMHFDGVRYYRIIPDVPVFATYESRKDWIIYHKQWSEWFEYKWDSPVLILISHTSYVTMKWRKL